MKVLVINLEKSKDRLARITQNLTSLNIPFEKFNAIYGKKLDSNIINKVTNFVGRTLLCNHGIIGCALSHIEIWKIFRDSNDDFILISEDDIEYTLEFPNFLKNIDNIYSKTQFDILSLNCSVGILISKIDPIFVKKYEISKPMFPLTTASYILSRKGVNRLLSMITKITYHIDFEIAWNNLFRNLDYYNVKTPRVLYVKQTNESDVSVVNNGILNKCFGKIGLHKVNWFLNNTVFTLFLNTSISVYGCILLIIMGLSLVKKNYIIFCIASIELIFIMS